MIEQNDDTPTTTTSGQPTTIDDLYRKGRPIVTTHPDGRPY